MLSDRTVRLLTAYVDGELSGRQLEAVQRLLRRSDEARALVERLQADAAVLRSLPRRRPHHDLSQQVLRSIAERKVHPARRSPVVGRPAIPVWAGVAAAAAVLLVLVLCSYFYFAVAGRGGRPGPAVVVGSQTQHRPDDLQPSKASTQPAPPNPEPLPSRSSTEPSSRPPRTERSTNPPDIRPPAESPEERPGGNESLIGNPVNPGGSIEDVRPRLLYTAGLRELDQGPARQRLREELLRNEGGDHLELFCLDHARALDRLRSGFEALGVQLLIDPVLKKPGHRTDCVLFTDCLTPEQAARLLEQLGTEDKQAEAGKRGAGQFGKLIAAPWTADDARLMSELLGVDFPRWEAPRPKGPLGVDIHKPLSEGTADQVAHALAGQGGGRPGAGKPPVKPPQRLVLALPDSPLRARAAPPPEVKQFLDNHPDRQPGAVRLLLVLRCLNG